MSLSAALFIALAGLLLVYLLVHAAVVTFAFVLHYFDAATSPGVRPAPLAHYARAWTWECFYTFVVSVTWLIGWAPPFTPWRHDPAGGPPILLVHGYTLNRACWLAAYWRLRRLGYRNVYTLNVVPMFAPLEVLCDSVGAAVRAVAHLSGEGRVFAVGHSQGGLLLRLCATREQDLPLAKIITLGSPHQGTRIAVFGVGENARQMRVGSELLQRLGQPRAPMVSIYSRVDNLVIPAHSASLGDDDVVFADKGHLTLLYDDAVLRALVNELPPPSRRA